MAIWGRALHHLNLRERVHKEKEHYPSQNDIKRRIDVLILISAFLIPIINLPQFYNIWFLKNASGVSALSWFGFSAFSVLWFTYGALHKDKAIMIVNMGLFLIQILIATGTLIYG